MGCGTEGSGERYLGGGESPGRAGGFESLVWKGTITRIERDDQAINAICVPDFDQLVWAGVATMPGLPATAVPAGRSPEGLPVGVQIIGPLWEVRTPLRLAELLEERFGGFGVVG